jgi:hypothetical protein
VISNPLFNVHASSLTFLKHRPHVTALYPSPKNRTSALPLCQASTRTRLP